MMATALTNSVTALSKTDPTAKIPSESAHGADDGHDHKMNLVSYTKDEVTIKVKGMVCAFCAQGIKKNFEKQAEVKTTDVNLDNMMVKVKFAKGKSLSEKKVKEIVESAGFSYVGTLAKVAKADIKTKSKAKKKAMKKSKKKAKKVSKSKGNENE